MDITSTVVAQAGTAGGLGAGPGAVDGSTGGGVGAGAVGGPAGLPSATATGAPASLQVDGASPVALVDAGYPANLSAGASSFAESLARVRASSEPSAVGRAMVQPLDRIDDEARALADYAEQALASGNELTPSEIVTLTTKSHEFMFHAQLTTNMANRTADGLQQLLRQQG